MNKAQLIEKIAEDASISKSNAGTVLQALLGAITKTKRKARKGRNPSTGEAIKIKATTSVRFKSSKALKEAM